VCFHAEKNGMCTGKKKCEKVNVRKQCTELQHTGIYRSLFWTSAMLWKFIIVHLFDVDGVSWDVPRKEKSETVKRTSSLLCCFTQCALAHNSDVCIRTEPKYTDSNAATRFLPIIIEFTKILIRKERTGFKIFRLKLTV